jgi:hypothetical protein
MFVSQVNILREEDVKVRVPGILIIKFIVRRVLCFRDIPMFLEYWPEDPSRTQKGPLVYYVLAGLERSERLENRHMEQKRPTGRVFVKFLERPFINGFSTDLPSLLLKQTQLGGLA